MTVKRYLSKIFLKQYAVSGTIERREKSTFPETISTVIRQYME